MHWEKKRFSSLEGCSPLHQGSNPANRLCGEGLGPRGWHNKATSQREGRERYSLFGIMSLFLCVWLKSAPPAYSEAHCVNTEELKTREREKAL